MQFREVAWAQQLYYQRLLHGPGAEATERSYPNYPGSALREVIRQSEHPHNLEPLLLTLRRPVNTKTRKSFAEVAGELVLIQKVTSSKPIATDFQVAVHGQVLQSPEGILYPTKDVTTTYETWLRVEMLDVLRMMIEENLVRSLVPEMQLKLLQDMLALTADPQQHELIRLYAFSAAFAALKKFPAARAAALRNGFVAAAIAYLRHVLQESSSGAAAAATTAADGKAPAAADDASAGGDGSAGGSASSASVFAHDPFELLKALTTCIEALYLSAVTARQGGDYALAAGTPAAKQPPSLGSLQRPLHLDDLQQQQAAPLLVAAVEKCWDLLQQRDSFEYSPPAKKQQQPDAGDADADDDAPEEGESEERRQMRQAAEEAAEAASVSFEENWAMFLKAVYDTEVVPAWAAIGVQLACCLLQLLAHKQGPDGQQLPSVAMLQQMSHYSADPMNVLAATAGILLGQQQAQPPAKASTAAANGSAPGAAVVADGSPAIIGLPQHEELEFGALGKLCFACGRGEGRSLKLLRCSQCGLVAYCSGACQKADWKAGHKGACKELGEARERLAAAAGGQS